jgi:hypothetical protein
MIPFAAQLREQLAISGAEALENVVINGDTTASVSNINDTNSGGGGAAGTEIFCLFDGFRHLGLVTNTDNKRAGGALSEEDYLETMWLMGTAGLAGADVRHSGDRCVRPPQRRCQRMDTRVVGRVWLPRSA